MANQEPSNTTAAKANQQNPSLVVTADHRIKMEEAPIPEPGVGEVLLHVRATGICGSDLHFWKHGAIGSLTVDGDCILGHEAAGVVLARGPGVDNLEIGMWTVYAWANDGGRLTSMKREPCRYRARCALWTMFPLLWRPSKPLRGRPLFWSISP